MGCTTLHALCLLQSYRGVVSALCLGNGEAMNTLKGVLLFVQRIPGWLIWMHWIDPLNFSVPPPLLLSNVCCVLQA